MNSLFPIMENVGDLGKAFLVVLLNQQKIYVISKRFVKKQQMRWTPKGAHLRLQIRTQVLNQELKQKFQEWYPGFEQSSPKNVSLVNAV